MIYGIVLRANRFTPWRATESRQCLSQVPKKSVAGTLCSVELTRIRTYYYLSMIVLHVGMHVMCGYSVWAWRQIYMASTGHAHAIVGAIIERLALIHCRLLLLLESTDVNVTSQFHRLTKHDFRPLSIDFNFDHGCRSPYSR